MLAVRAAHAGLTPGQHTPLRRLGGLAGCNAALADAAARESCLSVGRYCTRFSVQKCPVLRGLTQRGRRRILELVHRVQCSAQSPLSQAKEGSHRGCRNT